MLAASPENLLIGDVYFAALGCIPVSGEDVLLLSYQLLGVFLQELKLQKSFQLNSLAWAAGSN